MANSTRAAKIVGRDATAPGTGKMNSAIESEAAAENCGVQGARKQIARDKHSGRAEKPGRDGARRCARDPSHAETHQCERRLDRYRGADDEAGHGAPDNAGGVA